jgi:molybdopterin-binding protein
VPPEDITVSTVPPLPSSARNVFQGRLTRTARRRDGAVHLTADVGIDLVAEVTPEAAQELQLVPGGAIVFAFKAAAVRVF